MPGQLNLQRLQKGIRGIPPPPPRLVLARLSSSSSSSSPSSIARLPWQLWDTTKRTTQGTLQLVRGWIRILLRREMTNSPTGSSNNSTSTTGIPQKFISTIPLPGWEQSRMAWKQVLIEQSMPSSSSSSSPGEVLPPNPVAVRLLQWHTEWNKVQYYGWKRYLEQEQRLLSFGWNPSHLLQPLKRSYDRMLGSGRNNSTISNDGGGGGGGAREQSSSSQPNQQQQSGTVTPSVSSSVSPSDSVGNDKDLQESNRANEHRGMDLTMTPPSVDSSVPGINRNHDDSSSNSTGSRNGQGASVPFLITRQRREELVTVWNYTVDEVKSMTPIQAALVIQHGVHPDQYPTQMPVLLAEWERQQQDQARQATVAAIAAASTTTASSTMSIPNSPHLTTGTTEGEWTATSSRRSNDSTNHSRMNSSSSTITTDTPAVRTWYELIEIVGEQQQQQPPTGEGEYTNPTTDGNDAPTAAHHRENETVVGLYQSQAEAEEALLIRQRLARNSVRRQRQIQNQPQHPQKQQQKSSPPPPPPHETLITFTIRRVER